MTNLITNFIFFVLFILDFTKQAINLDKVCPKYNYDSLQYVCNTACSKRGYNTCYSETEPISIYTFDPITLPSTECDYTNGEIITELSGDRKLLVSPQCAKDEFDYYSADSTIIRLLAERDSILTVDLSAPENVLTVSGDTCTFSYARATREITFYDLGDTVGVRRKLSAVQSIGGPVEQQKKDNGSFRMWARSRAYDKNGMCLWSLCSGSPMMPGEVNRPFRYVVTMGPYEEKEPDEIDVIGERLLPDGSRRFSPVFIPITVTRSGTISYGNDMPRLESIQLYYHEFGKTYSSENALGTITLEDALDPDHLDAIKVYLKDYFDEHEEVDRMELWELILFNNPPGATSVQR